MRAKEFTIEHLDINKIDDIGEYQVEEMRRELLGSSILYENTENYQKIKNFLNRFNEEPIVDQEYLPMSVSAMPLGKIISIARTTKFGKLEKVSEYNLYFNFGEGPKPFPYNLEGGDNLRHTILCKSIDDQEKFIEWAYLSFNDWKITEKII